MTNSAKLKLVKVTPEPFTRLHCIGDPKNHQGSRGYELPYFNTDSQNAYADLNGEPYKAYYCRHCVAEIQKFEPERIESIT